ncbi:arsenosugar biosynthesis radical SAM (seleno)protein ArsS [Gimesia panareensis]|uniref:arsenosugar biosynthesis radical SAM (seleno)protein ArsS n=1 Tax=Gimesia panareensis TaxID=2527978 RepID=UPI00118BE71B|nr:arsenosugar biosynthesis radical SAM (seleno)protein ArsS [Gimesia panareensis]QDU49393.1 molybdenum cofactor biosynthesis protein A [Gimesia panareensis]
MASLTLLRQQSKLADPREQLRILDTQEHVPRFADQLEQHQLPLLQAATLETLQVNLGRLCNMTCEHCHVDAGPDRREIMQIENVEHCLRALAHPGFQTLDLTGGAPEMNPHFRLMVTRGREMGKRIIDRCNLTILLAPGYRDLPEFLAAQEVEIVASLPCYLEENTDAQRGSGAFQKSIQALQRLNGVGYGGADSPLKLTLVYNPVGYSLPPDQGQLEAAYREQLRTRFGIEFSNLITITNMPISRYLNELVEQDRLEAYMSRLVEAFNPETVPGVMCRSLISVDWQGYLYDCDFNQMLALPVSLPKRRHISDFDYASLAERKIVTQRHCYGCTAGAGSSCGGALNTP